MANRGTGRAAAAAQAGNDLGNDDDYFETPLRDQGQGQGDGEGVQGDGGEGGDDPEDATLNAGEEQETGGEEDLGFEDPEPRPTRGQNRIQALSRENADLKRQIEDINVRLRAQPTQTQTPAARSPFPQMETEEAFRARIASLPPDERMEERAIRAERKQEIRDAIRDFQQAQSTDKLNWDASCATSQRRQRWSAKVEAEHARLAQNGQYVNREVIYKYLLGEWVDSPEGSKRLSGRRAAAEDRVRRQTVNPSSPRGDVGGAGQRRPKTEADARRQRLENMQI